MQTASHERPGLWAEFTYHPPQCKLAVTTLESDYGRSILFGPAAVLCNYV